MLSTGWTPEYSERERAVSQNLDIPIPADSDQLAQLFIIWCQKRALNLNTAERNTTIQKTAVDQGQSLRPQIGQPKLVNPAAKNELSQAMDQA